jgi:hypothetical protein
MLAGDGGHGKSWITLDIAARGSKGAPCLGLSYSPAPLFETLLIYCEDDSADTVRPRLLAARADCRKIHEINVSGNNPSFSLANCEPLRRWLKEHPACRLVVIDPAGAYIGRTGADDHKDSELRALLGPLSELAAEMEVTIVLVKHFNKGANLKAVHKVTGSVAYVNAVRAAFCVAPETADENSRRLLLPLKFNLQLKPKPLAYHIRQIEDADERDILVAPFSLPPDDHERLAAQLARIVWDGSVDADTEEVLAAAERKDRKSTRVEECMAWLKEFLKEYAYPAEEIFSAALAAGFTRDNVWKAKGRLKEAGLRNRTIPRGRGPWWSGFGDPDGWKQRPDSMAVPETPETPETHNSPESHKSHNSPETPKSHQEEAF